jgi:hypothetical protein
MSNQPPRFAHITDGAIEARLIELRERVTPILANNLLPHFTDHSVAHSDSLVKIVDQLIQPLQQSGQRLTQDELQILYSACYLHDIGMQYENADQTQVISNLRLPQSWNDLAEDTRRLLLRQHHGAISAEMVILSVRAEQPPIGIQLKQDHYAKYVAPICEGHTLDTTSIRYCEIIKDGPNIRTSLLSSLLRVADILDLSQRRANTDKARTLRLDLESQTHWWRHYYTEDIKIDQNEKTVTVWFDFPAARFVEYRTIVPQLQMPWIRAEFDRHAAVFNRWGLGWTVQEHIELNSFSTAEVMPDDVESEMLRHFHLDQTKEQERQRQALDQLFTQAKPNIERRLAELEGRKNTLQPSEYLREIVVIASDLATFGGKRSAWALLSEHYQAKSSSLEPTERLEIGVTLASIMFDDSYFDGAARTLRVLLPLGEHLVDGDPLKSQLTLLWAKTLVSVGDYTDGVPFISRAIESTSDLGQKELLRAELAELQFLYGAIDDALATSGSNQ